MIHLCLLLVSLPALTLAQGSLQPYNVTAAIMFSSVDINVDGFYDKVELHISYQHYDANGDGRISRHEYTGFIQEHSPELYVLSHGLYDVMDIDGDNHLDEHDLENFFSLMDSNTDELVSKDEYVRYWSILLANLDHSHD